MASAISGLCTIICDAFVNGTLTGPRACTLNLSVPESVILKSAFITCTEIAKRIDERFCVDICTKSRVAVTIMVEGGMSIVITSYHSPLKRTAYTVRPLHLLRSTLME